MLRTSVYSVICVLCMLAVSSCGHNRQEEGVYTVSADIEKVDTLDVSAGRLVALETNDSSLIYGISNLEKAGDRLVVHSRDILKTFDPTTGKYLGEVATKGDGPDEFTSIQQIWVENDTIRLLDFNTGFVGSYLGDGTFLYRTAISRDSWDSGRAATSPVYLMADPGGEGYISLNSFSDGTTKTNPTASLYGKDLRFIRDIEGRSLREGSYLSDRMTPDIQGERLLMWEPFRDTLFTVTTDGIRPWLAFDFGKNRFPTEYQALPELFERAQKFIEGKDVPYASFLHSYQKWGDRLFFSVSTPDSSHFVGVLDLDDKNVKIYRISDREQRFASAGFLKIIDGKLFIALNDTQSMEANPYLLVMDPDFFK